LTSARYAADYAEVKAYGRIDSTVRTAEGTETARLWAADGPQDLWDPVADALITAGDLELTDAARVLAQTDIAMVDAAVAVWDAKNYYDTWRPITAIEHADADGNPATDPDPTWQPLLNTPPFQEYPSGHAGISQAGAAVLASRFGDATAFSISTPNMPGVVHSFTSFTAGVAEVTTARIDAGFHFRFSCDVADVMGRQIADYVTRNTMQSRSDAES
jgi:membrane-associated phospholipid phosphatase